MEVIDERLWWFRLNHEKWKTTDGSDGMDTGWEKQEMEGHLGSGWMERLQDKDALDRQQWRIMVK